MRIIIYIMFLCAVPSVTFAQEQRPIDVSITTFDTDSCAWLQDRGRRNYNGGLYKIAADTLKIFIERCYDKPDAWREFDVIGVSVAGGSDDPNRFYELLDWLKSVLYLNTTDSNYYCGDVNTIFHNFQYLPERGEGDYLGCLTIMKYVRESGRCPMWDNYNQRYDELYRFYMDETVKRWQDSVKDSIATPIDTTLPSLEDLGLGLLRGQNGVTSALPVSRLGELIATRNPFTDILELKYRLDKSAMVRIDVYDLLGRTVYSEGQGYKAEGEHVLSLQPEGWASGSYYVRLSSPSGEVKTVKVVKE
jgi:hypothetical protein